MQLKQVLANGKKGGLNVGQIGGRQLQLWEFGFSKACGAFEAWDTSSPESLHYWLDQEGSKHEVSNN
jgi:hypothetical protein